MRGVVFTWLPSRCPCVARPSYRTFPPRPYVRWSRPHRTVIPLVQASGWVVGGLVPSDVSCILRCTQHGSCPVSRVCVCVPVVSRCWRCLLVPAEVWFLVFSSLRVMAPVVPTAGLPAASAALPRPPTFLPGPVHESSGNSFHRCEARGAVGLGRGPRHMMCTGVGCPVRGLWLRMLAVRSQAPTQHYDLSSGKETR